MARVIVAVLLAHQVAELILDSHLERRRDRLQGGGAGRLDGKRQSGGAARADGDTAAGAVDGGSDSVGGGDALVASSRQGELIGEAVRAAVAAGKGVVCRQGGRSGVSAGEMHRPGVVGVDVAVGILCRHGDREEAARGGVGRSGRD